MFSQKKIYFLNQKQPIIAFFFLLKMTGFANEMISACPFHVFYVSCALETTLCTHLHYNSLNMILYHS